MTHETEATWIGFAGVALLLVAFLLSLIKRLRLDGYPYAALNVVGAGLACYSSYLISFMPFVVLEGVWALVAAGAIVRKASKPRSSTADATSEAAIRAIIAEQAVAWNAGDGVRYADHLTPDASFTNLFEMVMYGAAAFGKRHSEILSTFYKG